MTNKEKYIKSIDNLKADEYLKASVLKKLQEKPKKSFYFKLANVAIIMIFVISCTILMSDKDNVTNNSIYKNQGIAKANSKIKSVENEETLKKLLESTKEETDSSIINPYFESSTNEVLANSIEAREQSDMYAKTNVQVEGVDEADIVKTDGNYIYYSGINDKVIIVDTNLNKVAEIKLEDDEKDYGGTQELYIYSNKLITISQNHVYAYATESVNNEYNTAVIPPITTKIKIYNIEDKSNIINERNIEVEGNYISSRMIGEELYLITNQYININNENLQPSYKDSISSEQEKFVKCSDIFYVENENIKQYLNIAGLNVNKKDELNVQTFLGMGSIIYANENNLYVTSTKYDYKETNNNDTVSVNVTHPKTQIYKFKMIDSKVEFKEFAEVEGSIINQFAMDETDGYFRIATTSFLEDNKTSNNIYVLDARLKIIGKLTKIAEGETIYSVRFTQDKAYMVTYEQVDPLFVIDLSKPNNPQIQGQLKIPGYSTYLHPYDEEHLIGIGQETKALENGEVETIGLKISLYDISDVNSPKEVSKYIIEGNQVYTEALYNHKALLFIKEKGILAFPITISTGPKTAFYGTEILSINLEDGIEERGRITTDEKGQDYRKAVDRIIYIGDNLYNISRASIISNNIITLEQTGRVDF